MPKPNLDPENKFLQTPEKNNTTYVYRPRLSAPESNNPYYNTRAKGGYSTAIIGNANTKGSDSSVRKGDSGKNVLPNCVGYAYGRFNEIAGLKKMAYLSPVNGK